MKTINFSIYFIICIFCIALLTSCATTGTPSKDIPDNKLFSRIKPGMSESQMTDLIGIWSDSAIKTDPLSFLSVVPVIGLFFGYDAYQIAYYKGNGRVTLKGDRIVKIEYDPTEDGYK